MSAHYGRAGTAPVLEAVAGSGVPLASETLAPLDGLHVGGIDATRSLAGAADLKEGLGVLDLGSGLGGSARLLARDLGCDVTGLDLTRAYCRIAGALTRRLGLERRARFACGDALRMPFADESFEVVWSQHATMNVAAKDELYREVRRVLRRGGRLALHEVVAGPRQPLHFPVPWADRESLSFLETASAMRERLGRTGLVAHAWRDATAEALRWLRASAAERARESDGARLGPEVLFGAQALEMGRNLARNLLERRVAIVEAVYRRP